jgi:hypothetical protein
MYGTFFVAYFFYEGANSGNPYAPSYSKPGNPYTPSFSGATNTCPRTLL